MVYKTTPKKLSPLEKQKEQRAKLSLLVIMLIGAIIIALAALLTTKKWLPTLISFVLASALFQLYFFLKNQLKISHRIKKIEEVFPDFIELMASNLRAGMTIDRALLLSARKEFAPLDTEIITVGKDLVTGKDIGRSLREMAQRINSGKIRKTVDLIITGSVSGGNLSILLEETAIAMRERAFMEKKASSNVLMYMIFIFVAASAGAPMLFGLSSVLVSILSKVLSGLPPAETLAAARTPFILSKVSVSPDFVSYFSLLFLIVTNVLAAFVLGLVSKGEEKEGVKFLPPLVIIGLTVFLIIKALLSGVVSGFVG